MKRWLAFGAAALLFVALPQITLAKSSAVQQEVATAEAHAAMAANADSIGMTHTHLQHVINCLVGPKGSGFDAAAENPCKGMGNGALVDAGKGSQLYNVLHTALKTAEVGVNADKLALAQQAAKKTAMLLKTARGSK